MRSIGLLMEQLPQLRTKDSADHAGLSQLLALLKVLCSLRLNTFFPSLSNNSLIVQEAMVTWAVTEVLWIMPSNILRPTVLKLNLNMDTLPDKDHANMTNQRVSDK